MEKKKQTTAGLVEKLKDVVFQGGRKSDVNGTSAEQHEQECVLVTRYWWGDAATETKMKPCPKSSSHGKCERPTFRKASDVD